MHITYEEDTSAGDLGVQGVLPTVGQIYIDNVEVVQATDGLATEMTTYHQQYCLSTDLIIDNMDRLSGGTYIWKVKSGIAVFKEGAKTIETNLVYNKDTTSYECNNIFVEIKEDGTSTSYDPNSIITVTYKDKDNKDILPTLNLIENFTHYLSSVVPYYYYGGSYLLVNNKKELYGMGWNDAKGKQYLLGLGDIEFTKDRHNENYAVRLNDVPGKVKYMVTISKNKANQSTMVFTEEGKVYGWGANAGLLPMGNAEPVKTPVELTLFPNNVKTFLWHDNVSVDAQVFTVLTEDGDVYTWGKKQLNRHSFYYKPFRRWLFNSANKSK